MNPVLFLFTRKSRATKMLRSLFVSTRFMPVLMNYLVQFNYRGNGGFFGNLFRSILIRAHYPSPVKPSVRDLNRHNDYRT